MSHAGAQECATSGRPCSHTAALGCPRARLQRTGMLGAARLAPARLGGPLACVRVRVRVRVC
eukprot:2277629-Prymnesium_polylepis.1